jgi:hypothetical protein
MKYTRYTWIRRDASEAPTAPLTTSTYLRERQSSWLLAVYSFPSPVENPHHPVESSRCTGGWRQEVKVLRAEGFDSREANRAMDCFTRFLKMEPSKRRLLSFLSIQRTERTSLLTNPLRSLKEVRFPEKSVPLNCGTSPHTRVP